MENCTEWLYGYLARTGKLQPRRTVRAEALKAGYGQQELKEARKNLGIILEHDFMANPETGKLEDYWRMA